MILDDYAETTHPNRSFVNLTQGDNENDTIFEDDTEEDNKMEDTD